MDLSETWHTCWPWGEDESYLLFDSGRKCVAMVTVPLSMLLCTNVNPRFFLTFIVIVSPCFHGFQWDLAHTLALRWRCDLHTFWQWQKVCCHGNGPFVNPRIFLTFLVIVALCFHGLQLDLAHFLALRWGCEQHIFWQWRKVCCHGTSILWQKFRGKIYESYYFYILRYFK